MDAVLFDMFGVIARDQSPEGRAALEAAAGVPAPAFWEAYWSPRQAYDRGDLTGVEYWRAVGEHLGTPFDDDRARELLALDLASWADVDKDMVEYVGSLAADGVPLGLLSNIPNELADYFGEHHAEVLELFPVLGLSCRIGSAKPEPEAYEWCRSRLGVTAERVLFVDDRPGNVAAAEALGMRGHRFTSRAALQELLSAR